jgi:hypothetical protein
MPDPACRQIDARIGLFAKRVTCRLSDSHLVIGHDTQATRIGYSDLLSIRIARHGPRRAFLGLTLPGGEELLLRLTQPSGQGDAVAALTTSLISRVAEVAPETHLRLGPRRRQWVAAWIGLAASAAIVVGAGWSLFTDGGIAPVLLPLGVALANLGVVVPILQAGPPRDCVVSTAPATLL